jgi:diadenosine tetraphosphate (Ap4A) HIT family hydrolase
MRKNTHCEELLQRNKHNEQQSHIHVILRNLGNQPGKTPMWGNPKRERERVYLLHESISTKKLQFPAREIYLHNVTIPLLFS